MRTQAETDRLQAAAIKPLGSRSLEDASIGGAATPVVLQDDPVRAAPVQHQQTPPAAAAAAADCPAGRRPYHIILTAASGTYQEWQARIAYYHYKKLRAAAPCGDLGGFTRLLSTPGGRPDKLVNEIPTVVVKQLGWGKCDECDHGFVVLNRPWSLLQLTRSPVRCWPRTPCARSPPHTRTSHTAGAADDMCALPLISS